MRGSHGARSFHGGYGYHGPRHFAPPVRRHYGAPYYVEQVDVEMMDPEDVLPMTITDETDPVADVISGRRAPSGLRGRAGQPSNTLADLFPILAPGARGMSARLALGPDQILRAVLCIDGRCYTGQFDLADAFDAIVARVTAAHAKMHADAGQPLGAALPPPAAVQEAATAKSTTAAVAGATLVGAMFDEHCSVISAGWFDSIKHAVSSAVNGVGHAASSVGSGIAHTMKKLKVPLSIAAAGAAVAFVGPQAGPIAGQMTGALIDAANGDGDAQQVVAAAQAAAQTDPTIAKALDAAHQAVAQTTAGFHVVDTVAKAVQGDPNAQQQVADLRAQASQGNAGAAAAMNFAAEAAQFLGGSSSSPLAVSGATGGDLGTMVAGALPVFLLATGAGVGGYALWRHHQKQKAIALAEQGRVAAEEGYKKAMAIAAAQSAAK